MEPKTDPALKLLQHEQPKGEPLPNSDDEGPPALEQGPTERPDDDPDEGEVSSVEKELEPRVASLELNKKLDVYRLNLGHQETDRILAELEANCEAVIEAGGQDAWIPVPGLVQFICTQLGYADEDEFEDALGGTFLQFIETLPHIETKKNEEADGRVEIRMKAPEGIGGGFIKRLRIKKSEDLWKTLLKAPNAIINIPVIEFEIGASGKRQLDSIYNHITTAMFNLSQHVSNGQVQGSDKEGILSCIESLSKMLDIEEEWEIVLTDRTGLSLFKPNNGVETIMLEPGQR